MRLAFDDTGSGDCVDLIHGHPFDRGLWDPQVAGLGGRFRVVVPDLRGFGAERPDYRPLLAGLDIPAFVCAGTADPWSTPAVTAEIVSCLKHPELTVFDNIGHLPDLEAEAEFNRVLGEFLRRQAPA
jgi:pimeloyl-ACP methyl ester carboxylesterase